MRPQDFKRWRRALHLSQKQAAEALGLKRRVVQYYEKGERDGEKVKIPRTVRLACAAITHGLAEWQPEPAKPAAKRPAKAPKEAAAKDAAAKDGASKDGAAAESPAKRKQDKPKAGKAKPAKDKPKPGKEKPAKERVEKDRHSARKAKPAR